MEKSILAVHKNTVTICKPTLPALFILIAIFFLPISCTTSPRVEPPIEAPIESTYTMPSLDIVAVGKKTEQSLVSFFMTEAPDSNRAKVERLAALYRVEGALEGINSDVAFAQMCLETGFLRFGGLVTEDMNNFCGLGAIDETQTGNRFETEQLGVRAHIQHLKAYGTAAPLVMPLVDPRYKWVNPKGKSPTVHGLSGTWASDPDYAIKIEGLLSRLGWY